MKRILLGSFVILACVTLRGREIDPRPPARLSVRIVPSAYREKVGRQISLNQPSDHFNVVITNVSDRPVRLWREWCSWGYFNLSFIVTGEDGKSVVVEKKMRGWDKNFPDATIVPPGDHLVWEVSFDGSIWQNSPMPGIHESRAVKMKAVYVVEADRKAEQFGVWTGRASSPEESFTIYH